LEPFISEAEDNLHALKENQYNGRGILIGGAETRKHYVLGSWTQGRSSNSRNRIYVLDEDGSVRTEAADPSKVEDPRLIIYRAMAERRGLFAVSNGAQTDSVIENYRDLGLKDVLTDWTYEPDPIHTPRITGVLTLRPVTPDLELSILRKAEDSDECEREFFPVVLPEWGLSRCITTYLHDGDPPPAYRGQPYLLPLVGSTAQEIAEALWECLNVENRISLAIKMIEKGTGKSTTHVINKYEPVLA